MLRKYLHKKVRSFRRWTRKNPSTVAVGLFLLVSLVGYTSYIDNQKLTIDPKSYGQLLSLIADAESSGNYNAYFNNASNQKINFTTMPIVEVMRWQEAYIAEGSPSSAVGRYQIINTTLASLVDQLDIDSQQLFDEVTQDKMAVALLERRGASHYINGKLSKEEFAANLAKEWAALPRILGDDPSRSYYAGDGINQSRVEVACILGAIELIRPL